MKRVLNPTNVSITLVLLLFGFIRAYKKEVQQLAWVDEEPQIPVVPVLCIVSAPDPRLVVGVPLAAPFLSGYDCH